MRKLLLALTFLGLMSSAFGQVTVSPPSGTVPAAAGVPSAYPCSPAIEGSSCVDPVVGVPPLVMGHYLCPTDQNCIFTGNNVFPFSVLSSNPIVSGVNAVVQPTTGPYTGLVYGLKFTSIGLPGSPITVTYTGQASDTKETVAILFCGELNKVPVLHNQATRLPFICDSITGNGTFNVQWDVRLADLTVTDVSTGGASFASGIGTLWVPKPDGLINPARKLLDFVVMYFGRHIPGYKGQVGDQPVCLSMAGDSDQPNVGNWAMSCLTLIDPSTSNATAIVQWFNFFQGQQVVNLGMENGLVVYGPGGTQPTGGFKGLGTINVAGGFYVNGTLLTGGGGGSPPAGPTGSVQFNAGAGLFGGSSTLLTGSAVTPLGSFTTPLQIADDGSTSWNATFWGLNANTSGGSVAFIKNRGTSPTALVDTVLGDFTMQLSAYGVKGGAVSHNVDILSTVDGQGTIGAGMPGAIALNTNDGTTLGTTITRWFVDSKGNVVTGATGLTTTATAGWIWTPVTAGPPTGVPAPNYASRVPIVYDVTNATLMVYNAGWKDVLNYGGPWTAYTPSVTCGVGSFVSGLLQGKYKLVGKTVVWTASVAVQTNSGCANFLQFSLPFAAATPAGVCGNGREGSLTGKSVSGLVGGGGNQCIILYYDGTFSTANGQSFTVGGAFETN